MFAFSPCCSLYWYAFLFLSQRASISIASWNVCFLAFSSFSLYQPTVLLSLFLMQLCKSFTLSLILFPALLPKFVFFHLFTDVHHPFFSLSLGESFDFDSVTLHIFKLAPFAMNVPFYLFFLFFLTIFLRLTY